MEILELKNAMPEIENTLNTLNSKSELENRLIEMTQSYQQREKILKKIYQCVRAMLDNTKSLMFMSRAQGEENECNERRERRCKQQQQQLEISQIW